MFIWHIYGTSCFILFLLKLKGVEKNNDDVRTFHLTKSNKWDAPKDILLVSKRLQVNSEQERKHRIYRKANNEYWSSDIKETRSKIRKLLLSPNPECQENNARSTPDIQSLTIGEIKEKLKQLGVKTRARKLEKLQDILQKALKDSC